MRPDARVVAVTGLSLSVASVILVHAVRPELTPIGDRLSEYANGSNGWLMGVAFVALGVALAAIGHDLGGSARSARVLALLAWVAAAGMVIAAVFRTGISPVNESVHSRASAIATIAIVVLAIGSVVGESSRGPRMTVLRRSMAFLGLGLLPVSVILHDTRWTGLGQRALWAALIDSLVLMSWETAPSRGEPQAP